MRTASPERRFKLTLGPERVALEPSLDGDRPDLQIPAEAFVRLVYGRLDDEHTPASRARSTSMGSGRSSPARDCSLAASRHTR